MKKNKAFTLVEMMVTMAIVAIMAVVAVPGFQDYQKKNEFNTAVSQIGALINQAAVMAKNPEKDATKYIIKAVSGKVTLYKNDENTELKSVTMPSGITTNLGSGGQYLIFNKGQDYTCNLSSLGACTAANSTNNVLFLQLTNTNISATSNFTVFSSPFRLTVQ